MTKEELEVIYRENKNTGKIHRILKARNGQILSGEQCNLDQAHNILDEEEIREAQNDALCWWCFGAKSQMRIPA